MRLHLSSSQFRAIALASFLTASLATSTSAGVIQRLDFGQDGVLPSAQPGIVFFNTTASAETALYSASDGQLHQRTLTVDGNASYLSPDASLSGGPFDAAQAVSMVVRVRILSIGSGANQVGGGAYFEVLNGTHSLTVAFQPGGLQVPQASGTPAFLPLDITLFHTYQLVSPGNSSEERLFVDGQLVFCGTAPASTRNGFDFGDGMSEHGAGANADWDFIQVSQDAPSLTAEWSASSGLGPEDVCRWALVNSSTQSPQIADGALTLSTAGETESMYYEQSASDLSVPSFWVIEARLRVVSESHSRSDRRGVQIGFTPSPGLSNVLQIDQTGMFLWRSSGVPDSVVSVATGDAFHDYRIEVSAGGQIQVFYDGALFLSGLLYAGAGTAPFPDLWWGDGTQFASSVSQWISFSHNGSTRGCGCLLFGPESECATGVAPISLAIGQLNGDGRPDLAVTNYSSATVSVLLGNGDGTFCAKTDYGAGNGPWSLAIGDLNSDGKLDLAATSELSNTVSVLLGSGNGAFGTKTDYATGTQPQSVAIGDLNGDGSPDLAVSNFVSSGVSVLLGNGDGTYSARADYGTGSNPISVAIGDLNGDGRPDLVAANAGTYPAYGSTVSVMLGAGDGTFGTRTDYGTGSNPLSVTIGDLNGDGMSDLVVANFASSTVSVLLGNGNGTFGAKTDYGAGSGPWSVAIRDLTGDGKPDLAVANFASNTVSVLRGNGNGTFGTRIDFGTGNKPISVAIEDLNGDGKPDLAAANYGSNTLSVLANTCSDPSGPTLLSPGDCSTATSNPYFVWQGIAGAASYQIAVSTNRLMTAPVWTTQCGSNSKTALYAGNPLSPGTPYYWSVRALVGGTWTPYAAAREFVRHSGTPAVAHPVLSAPVDQATLTLPETFSWDAVANAVSYRLKISTDATFVTSLWTSGVSTSPSLSVPGGIPGIANGQTYYWTVTAIDASGIEGPAATARRFVVSSSAAMPAQALLLSPSDGSSVTTQSVVFSWQAAAGATRFDLTYSTSPGFTVGSNTTWTLTDLTAPSTSVPLPAADVTIYWKVTPRNNSGAGPSSAVWSFHFNFSTGPITGITLLSPAHGLSIGLNARTTASARIVGSTSVIIYGHWRLDGADWAPFALVASNPNRILVNSLELPTGSASTHTVQCVVTSPSSAASLIQTYQVADRPPGAPASITATVTPATLTADGSSTAIVTVSVLDGTGLLVSTDNARPITIRVNGPASAVPASGITYDGQWTTGLVAGTTEGVALVTVEAAGLPAAVGRIPVAATYLTQLKKQAQAALDRLNPLPVPGLLASTPLIKLPQPDAQTMQALQDYVDNATDADTAGVLRLALAARTLGRIYTFHSSSDGGPGDLPVPGAMVLADDATQNLMAQIQLTVGVIVGIQKSAQLLHALNPLADQWIDEEISTLLEKLDDFVTQTLDDAGSAVDPTLRAAVLDGSQLAIGLMCAAATADWTHYFTTGVGVGLRAPVNAWILQEGFINAGAQSELTRALTLAQSPPARTAAQAWSSCQLAVDQARSTSTDFDRVSQSSKTDGDALSSLADVAALCSLLPGGMVAGVFAVTSEIWAAPQYMQGSATALQGLGNMPSIAHTAVTGIFGSTQASTSSDLARTASWTSRAGAHLASAPRAVWARLLEAEAAGQQSFEALAQMIAIAAAAGDAPGVASLLPQLISAADSLERASSLARAPLTAASADAPFEIAGYDTVATSTWQQANAASVGRATLSASALSYLLSPEDPTMRQAVVDAVASAINLNSQAHNATQHTVASLFTVPALPFVRLEQVDIPNTVTVGVPFHVQALWTNLGAGTATGVTVSMKSDSSLVVTSQNPLALPDLAPGDTARAVWVAIPARTFAADTLSRMLQLVRLSSRCENGYGSGHTRMAALAVPASTGVTGGHVFHPGLQLAVTPNPASSVATLRLTMPASGHARVEVYDVGGRRVATLSDGQLAAGTYQYRWVGLTGDQARAPSGVYLARVVTNRGTCTTRFVWIVQ